MEATVAYIHAYNTYMVYKCRYKRIICDIAAEFKLYIIDEEFKNVLSYTLQLASRMNTLLSTYLPIYIHVLLIPNPITEGLLNFINT